MGLPAPHRNVMHTDKEEIIKFNLVVLSTDFPLGVYVVLERVIPLRINETLNTLGNVFREFSSRNWPWRTAKIFRWYLSTPLSVAWPLDSNGDTWTPSCRENSLIAVLQASHARVQCIGERDSTFARVFHPEINGTVQVNFFHVSSSITVGVWSVHILRYEVTRYGHRKVKCILKELHLVAVGISRYALILLRCNRVYRRRRRCAVCGVGGRGIRRWWDHVWRRRAAR